MDDKIQKILDRWSNTKKRALQDLTYLMKVQDIKHIVTRSYVPSFNDGDPCLPVVQFIGKPNYVYEYYFVYLDKEEKPKALYLECGDEEIEDLEKEGVPLETINNLKEFINGDTYKVPSTLAPNYPIEEFDSFLYNISELIRSPDHMVMFTLGENGKLITYEEYYEHSY